MTLVHRIVTCGTTAQVVVGADNMPHEVHLHNMEKSSNQYVYIGGPELTVSNSIHLDPGESLVMTLEPNDELYALSDPNGLELGVLDVRKND